MNILDLINEDETIEIVRNDYKFTAICTSDLCRPSFKSDLGAIKTVTKNVDICPDCGEYLFWEKS